MRVSNNSAGRGGAGLDPGVFVRFELVGVGGGRGTRELTYRFTFDEIRRDPTHELGWDRCVVATRRSCHLGAVTRPPEIAETSEVAVDGKVSTVVDAGCMFHAAK